MNREGFTIINLLAWLLLICFLFWFAMNLFKNTFAATFTQYEEITDRHIYSSAMEYANENNNIFNNDGTACFSINELVDNGYLSSNYQYLDREKNIWISKNVRNKKIVDIKYIYECK